MKKAKYREVPKEYRRNYKKELAELCGIVAVSFIGAFLFLLMICI